MNNLIKRKNYIKIVFIFFLIVIPWFNANYFDEVKPVELIQEDLSFYEINPCQVSLAEFILADFNAAYQNHYFFRFNDYSSIECFGRVSGVTLINNGFYISIGTNSLVNFIIQGFFWTLLISFVKTDIKRININKSIYNVSLGLSSALFTYSIFSELRFYEQKLYFLEPRQIRSLIFMYLLIFFIFKLMNDVFIKRFNNLVNFIPALYFVIGVFSGYNFSFSLMIIVNLGIVSILSKEYNKWLNFGLIVFSLSWLLNVSSRFSFYPDKLRGFTSSSYDINSILYGSLLFIFLLNGILFYYSKNKKYINFESLLNTFSISGFLILISGYIGANISILNFLNYYYFGQQKYGIKINNPFMFDEYGEKVAWRGFYASAESIGEFFGLIIIFILICYFINKSISKIHALGLISALFGLYFSNNRTVSILVLLALAIFLSSYFKFSSNQKIIITVAFLTVLIYTIGFENISYPYSYSSNLLVEQSLKYSSTYEKSKFLAYLINENSAQTFFSYIFGFFSFIAYLLNRSEIWGIFFARYNPSFQEVMFGSGPFNFGKLYGEVTIKNTDSLLLPHSSLLSFILFFGVIGVFISIIYCIKKIYDNKTNLNQYGIVLLVFMFVNLIKNDTLNYFASFALYSLLIYFILNIKNKDLFKTIDD
mgnify:CR=1 FL=1